MAITSSEIRTDANGETSRSETQDQIDKYVKDGMSFLGNNGLVIEGEESISFVDEQPNYVESGFTNSYKKISVVVVVDSSGNDSEPLREIGWSRYKERVSIGSPKGEPKEYCRYADTVFVWPKPNATTYPTMKLSGDIRHGRTTTISFPDRYKEAILNYVIYRIFKKYTLLERAGKVFGVLSKVDIPLLLSDEIKKTKSTIRYSDI
jgi:hypothetical protein